MFISPCAGWLSKDESEASPRLTVILSCLMCFGGGVIMTSSLCHMLPDVQEVKNNISFPKILNSLNFTMQCIIGS